MNISENKIQEILRAMNDPNHLMDKMAPLEIDRLIELIAKAVNDAGSKPGSAKQLIIDQLDESADVFGYLNLTGMLNIDELLKRINEAQL